MYEQEVTSYELQVTSFKSRSKSESEFIVNYFPSVSDFQFKIHNSKFIIILRQSLRQSHRQFNWKLSNWIIGLLSKSASMSVSESLVTCNL